MIRLSLDLLRLLGEPEGGHEAAAEHAATFLGVPLWIWQLANLVLFLALLVYLLKKPLQSFLAERKNAVGEALRKAEADRLRAEELTREIETRLAKIETDLAEIRAHSKRESEAEQIALTAQTEVDAGRIVSRANAEMESRLRSARAELTAFTGDLAVELAAEILEKGVTPEDQKRLVREGTDALMAAGKG